MCHTGYQCRACRHAAGPKSRHHLLKTIAVTNPQICAGSKSYTCLCSLFGAMALRIVMDVSWPNELPEAHGVLWRKKAGKQHPRKCVSGPQVGGAECTTDMTDPKLHDASLYRLFTWRSLHFSGGLLFLQGEDVSTWCPVSEKIQNFTAKLHLQTFPVPLHPSNDVLLSVLLCLRLTCRSFA